MRQKYIIFRDGPNNRLIIQEYSMIETKVKKPISPSLKREEFTFLCEETYSSKIILKSISNGIKTLVTILRTHNFYPIEPYSTKIAETVMTLYNSSENGPVELFFDDVDLVAV
ncbi:MAG: hypothetical protein PVJ19_13770 [Desulfobacteraceae bacterium]|jgi:hypothetical protein